MNLTLTWCWREWRSQRAVLLAYTLLGLASLCLVFLLVPETWWHEQGKRALALSWFFAIGVVGVVAFAAPALVRNEFGSKGDQFVRRLPGALGPSFRGKLLFLGLAALALPLVCLLAGEGFLLAIGQPWHDLFLWEHNGDVSFQWPWPAVVVGQAALLTTWVWAIGTWLPGGRMALGGTILFALVLGVGVFAVLRQSPRLEQVIAWQDWLWLVPPFGLGVAAVSWVWGRRGGGPLRSALRGLAATAVGLLPPSAWLGVHVWDYHHPDLQRLRGLRVVGHTDGANVLLAEGAAHREYYGVPVRIDLRTGAATQLGPVGCALTPELLPPYTTWLNGGYRHWQIVRLTSWTGERLERDLLDLATGQRRPLAWDAEQQVPVLPNDVAAAVAAEQQLLSPLRAPGDRRVWFDGNDVCFAGDAGAVERVRWQGPLPRLVRALGHGFVGYFPKGAEQSFDLVGRQQRTHQPKDRWFVGGRRVRAANAQEDGTWLQVVGDGPATPIAGLAGARVLGLFDDDHLLCMRRRNGAATQLFLWHVHDEVRHDLALPPGLPLGAWVQPAYVGQPWTSLLARDPAGRLWLRVHNNGERFVLLDATTRRLWELPPGIKTQGAQLFAWPDAQTALVCSGDVVLRVDVATGRATQLYPRRGGA